MKFPDIEKGAAGFGSAWDRTKATVGVELDQLKATFDALMITIGDKVLPVAERFLKFLADHSSVVIKVAAAVGVLVGALAVLTVAEKAVDAVGMLVDAGPILLAVAAVAALGIGLYELYKHFKTVRDVVADAGHALSDVWNAAMAAAGAITKWFADGPLAYVKKQIGVLTSWWHQNGAEITKIWDAVWTGISAVAKIYMDMTRTEIKVFLDVATAVFRSAWDIISGIVKMNWDVIATVISTTIHVVLDVISAVLDIIQGKWSAAGHQLMDATNTAMYGIVHIIETIASGFGSMLLSAGEALVGVHPRDGLHAERRREHGRVPRRDRAARRGTFPAHRLAEQGHVRPRPDDRGRADQRHGLDAPAARGGGGADGRRVSGAVSAGQYRIGAAGGGGSGATVTVQLEWVGGGADAEFITWLQRNIRVRGGDPRIITKKVKFAWPAPSAPLPPRTRCATPRPWSPRSCAKTTRGSA